MAWRAGSSHARVAAMFSGACPPSQCHAQWIHRQEERGNHPVGPVFPQVRRVLGEMAFNILVALAPSDETTRILKATGALVLLPQLHKEIGVQQTVPTLAGERAPAAAFHHWVLRGIELGIHKETVRPSLAKVQEAQTILAEMPEHIAESKFEEITHALQQLRERIGNTITVVRSNAYGHALITYDRSKKSAPQGLHGVALNLGQRFAGRSQGKKMEPAPAPQPQILS